MGIANKITLTVLAAGICVPAMAQDKPGEKNVHIKMIQIINGDTTITEKDMTEEEFHELEEMRKIHSPVMNRRIHIAGPGSPHAFQFSFSDSLNGDLRVVNRMMITDSLAPKMRFFFSDSLLSREGFSPEAMRAAMKDLRLEMDTSFFKDLRSLQNDDELKELRLQIDRLPVLTDSLRKELKNYIDYSFSINEEDGEVIVKQFGPGEKRVIVKKLEGKPGEELNEEILLPSKDGKGMTRVIVRTTVKIEDMEKPLNEKSAEKNKNELKLEGLNFYPNPNDGRFTIDFETGGRQPVIIKITDINGRQVYQEEVKANGRYSTQVDLSQQGKGTYILSLQQGKRSITKKIVIE